MGQLFENMIILDLYKENLNRSLNYRFYFWRDTNLKEIDLILERGANIKPVEIKSSQTIQSNFFDNLNWLKDTMKLENKGILIYSGDQIQKRTHNTVLSWNADYKAFTEN